jgi:L-ascorbate metabolism protein UlaG (beta-lactamase superfamily)
MEIKYLGHSSFHIKSKEGIVVTDPYLIDGLDYPKGITADIVTISHSHDDHNNIAVIGGANPLILDLPGEYEKNGIRIDGFKSFHDKKKGEERGENVMFKITVEGVKILHCGDLGHTLTKDDLETIGDVDVLLIPVGGFYTIDAHEAVTVCKDIEPSLVIPMHYLSDELKNNPAFMSKLTTVEDFLKSIGQTNVEKQEKLVVTKEMLSATMQVVLL